jgi:hypothetical protein
VPFFRVLRVDSEIDSIAARLSDRTLVLPLRVFYVVSFNAQYSNDLAHVSAFVSFEINRETPYERDVPKRIITVECQQTHLD